METKIGQKEKPKFAPPSARAKQRQVKETTKSKDGDTKPNIPREINEKIATDTEEQDYGIEEVGVVFKKAINLSEKQKPCAGTGGKKKVGGQDDQAGGMVTFSESQSLSEINDEAGREGAEKKEKKEKLKNKAEEPDTGGDEDADGMTKKNKHVQRTGDTGAAQKNRKEKKRKEKTEQMPKAQEKREHVEKASKTLTDSQYDNLFDSVLGASELETCMEDARAILCEVELLQASIDQGTNKVREESEEEGSRDSCEEREQEEHEIYEDGREEMQRSYKERKETGAKGGSCRKRRREEEEDDDSETDEYDSWVQCSRAECKKWRRLQDDTDPSTLPNNWTCRENTDSACNSCDVPEDSWSVSKEEEFYYCSLVPGSLVWAQQTGYPWWPAMIERDPGANDFLRFKTRRDPFPFKCHVTYLGNPVSRAWVQRCRIRDYNDLPEQAALNMVRQQAYKKRLKDAIKMAGQAQKLRLEKRLNRFGFMTRRSTDGQNLEEDSDIEEILGLFVESSGKGSGRRKKGKDSGDEEVKPPQKLRKQTEERVEEPKDVAKEVEIKSEKESTDETGKKENDEKKKEECELEKKSQTEKPRKGVVDQMTDNEGEKNVAGQEEEKKKKKKPGKEKGNTKKDLVKEKKGTEKKENQKKGGKKETKEMQTALNKQEEQKMESRDEEVQEPQPSPVKESDDQAVPESAMETSLDTVPSGQEQRKDEEKETDLERDETEQIPEEVDGEQKTKDSTIEDSTIEEVEESRQEVEEEELMGEEKGEGETEEGPMDEPEAGREEVEERHEQEERVVEGLGLSDDDDGADFLDMDLDLMGCRDDMMKRPTCAAEEEDEEEDFSIMLFEE
ncbi:zinc finger CW-type PWWP domain protein 1 [Clupea harengus]|uniref:Zinc finger CW-type PWWP domain protein 1 n=1 Tax=Clupea harengus TaxID=7950 RepID=A0A6P8GQA8_CLUHA|nr:zinc finger CW-type PWWP domain protein 1 [Clupea harengus]